ncbi:MAG: divalent-cation tolerance protein CutA [Planctomycetota bacterium]
MKIAFVTTPPDEAEGLAKRAVESSLAACVNVIPGITSHYRWQDELHADRESLLMAKVAEDCVEEFVASIRDWHSYTCPEVIITDVIGGNPDYISWVESVDKGSSQDGKP